MVLCGTLFIFAGNEANRHAAHVALLQDILLQKKLKIRIKKRAAVHTVGWMIPAGKMSDKPDISQSGCACTAI